MTSKSDFAGICCQLAASPQRPADFLHHFRPGPEQILVVNPDFAPTQPFRQRLSSDVSLVLLSLPVMAAFVLEGDPLLEVSGIGPHGGSAPLIEDDVV